MPRVLDASRVAADEQRDYVIGQVTGDGQLTAVQGCIAEAVDSVFGLDLERDEVASGTTDDDVCVDDFHALTSLLLRPLSR
jgi:hypothetical protein